MALPLILTYAFNQLEQRGVILNDLKVLKVLTRQKEPSIGVALFFHPFIPSSSYFCFGALMQRATFFRPQTINISLIFNYFYSPHRGRIFVLITSPCRELCCCSRNSCWIMLFLLLLICSLFVHYPECHSGFLASKLSGVPDNARGVMGCS